MYSNIETNTSDSQELPVFEFCSSSSTFLHVNVIKRGKIASHCLVQGLPENKIESRDFVIRLVYTHNPQRTHSLNVYVHVSGRIR